MMSNTLKTLGIAMTAAWAISTASVGAPAKTITITGIWASNAPTTDYSVALESYAVSFNLPGTFSGTNVGIGVVTTAFTNFSYELDGTPVAGLPDNIAFYNSDNGGGLSLDYPTLNVEFFGADIGSSGTLKYGSFSGYPTIEFTGPLNTTNEGTTLMSVVPEPAAWAMMIVGFGLAGAAVRGSRRAVGPSRQGA